MKKTLLGVLLLAGMQLFATTHTITVKNFGFEPSALNVEVGDVIEWKWESGTHTTTSKNIPSGATSWNDAMSSTDPNFSYTITELGVYDYVCTPHEGNGMIASITSAAVATGLDFRTINETEIFPNPFHNQLTVDNNEFTKYQMFSVAGYLVKEENLYNKSINTGDLEKGIYFLVLFKNEEQLEAIRVIKE